MWWRCPSPTAISPASPPPGRPKRTTCLRCGSLRCATSGIRCRSISGSTASATHAKVILVRILGGYDWWRYGCDQLAAMARARGIKLALLPGECRDEDLRLIECSTLPRDELDALLGYFREGGPHNMTALVRRLAKLAGHEAPAAEAVEVPKAGFYDPKLRKGASTASLPHLASRGSLTAPVIPILFYRSMLLAPTSRRSMRCARRCGQRACSRCRSSSPA